MKPDVRRTFLIALLTMIAVLSTTAASAEDSGNAAAADYPNRPMRLIVPVAPSGGTDILARIIAERMSEAFHQAVVVDNRPGGGSIVGTDLTAKAAPDGYTLEMIFPAHAINVSLHRTLPFDPVADFAPVTLCASAPFILVLNPSVPARTVKEFIALAKAKPGQIDYASGGTGTSPHLAVELFKSMAGINLTAIPYNGGGLAIEATVAGQTQMTAGVIPAVLPFVQGGQLVGLGVTSPQRSALVPELPTVAEAGVPGYEAIAWYGIVAPAHTSPAIVDKLDREIKRILALPDVHRRLAELGFEPIPTTPEQFGAYIKSEIRKWAQVVKEAGIHID